jgi:hypothetical protein
LRSVWKSRRRRPDGLAVEEGDSIVILLCGGDKSTQTRDIGRAKDYWRDYSENDSKNRGESHD